MTEKATESVVFRWDWEPPRQWVREISRLAPRADRLSHLVLKWVPGRPEEPMQRWVIFEAVPAFAVLPNPFLAGQLAGLLGNPWGQAMHAWAAKYWLTEGCLPTPFWVLQGNAGGHKYRYNNDEREFAMWQGYPDGAPLIGDLPYAELTPLTLQLIRTHSVMTGKKHASFDAERAARTAELQRESRRLLLHSITESGVSDLAMEAAPIMVDTARRVEKGHGAHGDVSAFRAKYIETGINDPNV